MKQVRRTFDRRIHGKTVTIVESRDGVQRDEDLSVNGVRIGVIWTGRHTKTVYAKRPGVDGTRTMTANGYVSKDQCFAKLRAELVEQAGA